MVDVELNENDYKIVMSWYEIAFADKGDKVRDSDLEVMHKLMIMCKAFIDENKKFTSNND